MFFTINPKVSRPREVVRKLGEVREFDRFIMDGELWMKVPGGIKRAKGRTPNQLRQVNPNVEVLVP